MKSYTNLAQSKKLAEFLPLESADMEYMFLKRDGSMVNIVPFIKDGYEESDCSYNFVPCWSLTALFEVLPECVIMPYYAPNLQKEDGKYSIAYGHDVLVCEADSAVDAVVEMIIRLKEKDLL